MAFAKSSLKGINQIFTGYGLISAEDLKKSIDAGIEMTLVDAINQAIFTDWKDQGLPVEAAGI
jgi:hypothetical protein